MAGGLTTALTTYQTLTGQMGTALTDLGAAKINLDTAIAALTPAGPETPGPDTEDLTAASGQIETAKTTLDGIYASLGTNNEALSGVIDTLNTLDTETLTGQLSVVKLTLEALILMLPDLPGKLVDLKTGVDTLVTDYATLDAGIQDYTAGVASAWAGYSTLASGAATLAEGSASLSSGANTLYSGTTSLLSGIASIYAATGTLTDGAGTLDAGVADLLAGLAALDEGAGTVKEGTAALSEGTDGMDADIQAQIDELLASVTGGAAEPASFVSEKNGNVAAVQFVIRTAPIQMPAQPEPEPEEQPPLTFWQKLAALF